MAVGDVNGDGTADVIVGAGFQGGPRVAIFDGTTLRPGKTPTELLNDFYAFDSALRNGVFVTAADVEGAGKADVVFAFFGYNESFAGEAGLDKFKKDLDTYLKHLLASKFNGKSAPRVVLFSPIAQQDLKDRNLPDGAANNKRIELYTAAMKDVAKANDVVFVDLFTPSKGLYAAAKTPLTINGVHLNEGGDAAITRVIDEQLFAGQPAPQRDAAAPNAARKRNRDRDVLLFRS